MYLDELSSGIYQQSSIQRVPPPPTRRSTAPSQYPSQSSHSSTVLSSSNAVCGAGTSQTRNYNGNYVYSLGPVSPPQDLPQLPAHLPPPDNAPASDGNDSRSSSGGPNSSSVTAEYMPLHLRTASQAGAQIEQQVDSPPTTMICIAVFRDHTSRELSWSLFISDDPEYKHKVTLYTIEPTTSHWRVGRTSWRQRETSESLRRRRDLICVIELPQCTWTPGQLRVFIQHELRRPEADDNSYRACWSTAHWVCRTVKRLSQAVPPSGPFIAMNPRQIDDLWEAVWNAAILYASERKYDQNGHGLPNSIGIDIDRDIWLHPFPVPDPLSQRLRAAHARKPQLPSVPPQLARGRFSVFV